MCTLSWIRDSAGYELHFNRDERHTRAHAHPPELSCSAGLRVLAPRDGDFGGAWIGVNERGLGLALLNGWHLRSPAREEFRSRGLLVLDALGCDSLDDLRCWLRRLQAELYRPFTLCAFAPARRDTLRADWDASELALGFLSDDMRPLVSSSYRYEDVVERRRLVFRELAGEAPDAEGLARFHASHRPERGPLSTCMHRDDASTKSYTTISVREGEARLTYLDSAPCEPGTTHQASLPLRGARET